ncbi:hypothetical protein ACN9MZ_18140 [Pseudoduganella sp. S-14]|jgi:hypothetical protein|uniref:hypothetical protein n=1 Tax=Pseudoduganella sp. S-14 TaxID=3404065 RepID=UPI003CF21C60
MDIKTQVYFTHREGSLFKTDLANQGSKRLAEHEFANGVNMTQSSDGRWISYLGVRAGGTRMQYWLLDRHANSNRLVYEQPSLGASSPSFSPDSKYLVIGVSAGLFLFDTATLKRTKLTLPVSIPVKEIMTLTRWSKDSTELLILVRSNLHNGHEVPFEFLSYRPASNSFEKLAAKYESNSGHSFIRNGREIPAFEDLVPRSSYAPKAESSRGGTWHAFVENKADSEPHVLKLRNRNGKIKTVASILGASCGRMLISGWLDEDHLVIRHGFNEFLVIEASSGNIAELPEELKASEKFTW